VRVALLSPYSWTYPGGVTRHIEALAAELAAAGHEPRILAPFDPDDALSLRLHTGARPQPRVVDESFLALGRTVGIAANGAVSNVALTPHAVLTMREELRSGGYDVVHVHEPVVPVLGWDALCSTAPELPLVGTFHTYSENELTNGIAAVALGGRRRMNRLRVRIAVSDAAAWTARRFYGGRYRIVPNGVHLQPRRPPAPRAEGEPLRILFVGQAVERKGLPFLLQAFEALRDQIPATLTLVGAGEREIAHMMLDGHGVIALGKLSEERKLEELARADVVCAPSLNGESFGMVLTEAFAASAPVLATDIPGYRDVVRDGVDGLLVAPGDALALAEALRRLALDEPLRARMSLAARERAERFAWPHVAAEVLDCYEQAREVAEPTRALARASVRFGLVPADLQPRIPPERLPSLQPARLAPPQGARTPRALRRGALALSSLAALAVGLFSFQQTGANRVLASLLSSRPGLLVAGLVAMCAAMFARALAWHAILRAAPTWRRAKRRDAMQGTFIGVLMSATLPARLGEPSRALIVARRLGRVRERLPVVLGTVVSQTILNLFALAVLGAIMFSTVGLFHGHEKALIIGSAAPLCMLILVLATPVLLRRGKPSRFARLQRGVAIVRGAMEQVRAGLSVFRNPKLGSWAAINQLGAWALQATACYVLLVALGLDKHVSFGAAAAVLFAVNVTAVLPATPSNLGVFQAACVAVLSVYGVSHADALAYGIILQAVEIATAVTMGMPALLREGLSWKDMRLRALHTAPVELRVRRGKKSGAAGADAG
jgi:phosphatidyl-myo-inositol alpha-mannosyltransferase